MSSKEFNKKYGLNLSDKSTDLFKRVVNNQKNFVNVGGKPKKMAAEVFKRYFTNWSVVFFTVIFLVVLLLSLIVTFSSTHDANHPVSSSTW
ncbi:hypothetical protein [Mycoplasma buteonis]|uniref:hypothetical protein n=1 Tax=Mycoplasma buteonis TaxID=171280 RepID=UPI000B0F3346|nr:hypothetical protein [Mycoplasma buteonis]